MTELESKTRSQICKKLSEIYFDKTRESFSEEAYIHAITKVIRCKNVEDSVAMSWKYSPEDIEKIIKTAIEGTKQRDIREESIIYTDRVLTPPLHGRKLYPLDVGVFPIPVSELPGEWFVSSRHYIQALEFDSKQKNFYLRDMENEYFFRLLYPWQHQYHGPETNQPVSFTTLGRYEKGDYIVVGIALADGPWELSVHFSDEVIPLGKILDNAKKIFSAASDIDIQKVSEETNELMAQKVLLDHEKRGFFVQNKDLLDTLGGNPNALTDDEFRMVFGEGRD